MNIEIPRLNFLWAYLYHWAEATPDGIALHENGKSMTYAGLELRVNHLAGELLLLGLEKGDRVVTILPSVSEYLVIYLAVSQLGGIITPLDVRYKATDLERFLNQSAPKVVFAWAKTKDNPIWEHLARIEHQNPVRFFFIGDAGFGDPYIHLMAGNGQPGLDAAIRARRKELTEEDSNLIVFTGGTTGQPKGALLSHRNVVAMAYHEEAFLRKELRRAGFKGRISTLAALPPSHVGGTIECIGLGLLGGHELYFLEHWKPEVVLKLSAAAKIPWLGGVPTMYAMMLSLSGLEHYDRSGFYLALLSGERVTLELITGIQKRLCPRIINGYGSTEAGAELTFTLPEDAPEKLAEGYVGFPLPQVFIKILGTDNKVLSIGQTGEVVVKSDFTIRQYFRMPEEDKAGFTEDGFCRTGDLGYLTGEGALYLKGRKKQVIRVGSYTVMPTEVEELALQIPEVAIAAALGAPHAILGEEVWLFVVAHTGETLREEAILAFIKNSLADYKVPRRVVVRESIPVTRIGKADRNSLIKEMEEAGWTL
ncbi:MAG: class I adenylate-forming enzyme family protein [Saprospiraceae bacterium]|nr:class I adenylate-forming enzyme family protein [Saprospiraceae bacterium]MDZ4703287.1 class I adenylate-forming enzyme family protein [Saprospiraceae bacterium]